MKSDNLITSNNNLTKEEYLYIRSRIGASVLKCKDDLESEGYKVPSTDIYVKTGNSIKHLPNESFMKLFHKNLNIANLSIMEKGIVLELSNYIGYEDTLLTKRGTPLTKKDLYDVLDLGRNAVDKYINQLISKNVLYKSKAGRSSTFYLNPNLFYRGNNIETALLKVFSSNTP